MAASLLLRQCLKHSKVLSSPLRVQARGAILKADTPFPSRIPKTPSRIEEEEDLTPGVNIGSLEGSAEFNSPSPIPSDVSRVLRPDDVLGFRRKKQHEIITSDEGYTDNELDDLNDPERVQVRFWKGSSSSCVSYNSNFFCPYIHLFVYV